MQCPIDSFYNTLTLQCQTKCQNNQQFVNGICQCIGGMYQIDGICQSCTYPSMFYNGKCINCPVNSNYINGNCVCSGGYYIINGVCTGCATNEVYNGYQCICVDGFTRNTANQCVKNYIPTCGMNQYWDSKTNTCQCNLGYVWIVGQCQLINSCDQYSFWNGNQCVCQSGYTYSTDSQRCIPQSSSSICPLHSSFNGVYCCCD